MTHSTGDGVAGHPSPPAAGADPSGGSLDLPDIRAALPWRTWSEARAEAAARRVPILAYAEPSWANSSQRIAYVLERLPPLRDEILEGAVPALLEPLRQPDLVRRLRHEAMAVGATAGPPLVTLCVPDGTTLVPLAGMHPEGNDELPSWPALIEAAGEALDRPSAPPWDEFRPTVGTVGREGESQQIELQALAERILEDADLQRGGYDERPKHPHATLLWAALELIDALADGPGEETARELRAFVASTLRAMARGGMQDQLAGGFHRCARDERWIVPHFEKPGVLNAQLAAVYARAARLLGEREFFQVAERAAAFASACLDVGTDGLASDTRFYTWTPKEFQSSLEPELQQVLGFHYHVTPSKTRHTLYRALEPEDMDSYTFSSPEALRARVERGRFQLLQARNQRGMPERFHTGDPRWRSEMATWLIRGASYGLDADVAALAALLREAAPTDARHLERDWRHAASIAEGLLEAARLTEGADLIERARALLAFDRRGQPHAPGPDDGPDVMDEDVSSATAIRCRSLFLLAEAAKDGAARAEGIRLLDEHRNVAHAFLPWSGSWLSAELAARG